MLTRRSEQALLLILLHAPTGTPLPGIPPCIRGDAEKPGSTAGFSGGFTPRRWPLPCLRCLLPVPAAWACFSPCRSCQGSAGDGQELLLRCGMVWHSPHKPSPLQNPMVSSTSAHIGYLGGDAHPKAEGLLLLLVAPQFPAQPRCLQGALIHQETVHPRGVGPWATFYPG